MRRFPGLLLIGLVTSLQSLPAAAQEESCVADLQIAAPEDAEPTLRETLSRGPLAEHGSEECRSALVRLERTETGWQVSVALGQEQVQRNVESIADASVWIESWLLPALGAAQDADAPRQDEPAAAPEPADAAATRPEPAAPGSAVAAAPASRVGAWPSGRLGLAGAVALGNDTSGWGGGELFGQLTLGHSIWVGATLGGALDPVFDDDSAAGDDVHRSLMRASVQGGLEWPVGSSMSVAAGLGVGLLSAFVSRETQAGRFSDDEGAGFAEVFALGGYEVASGLELVAGLSLQAAISLKQEEDDADDPPGERDLPAAHPSLLVAGKVGVAYRFRGAR